MAGHSAQASTRPEAQLFEAHALRLRAVVSRSVRTSPVNVEDACAFAWLQLVRRRPPTVATFAWLRTTAIREAVKLHRRSAERSRSTRRPRSYGTDVTSPIVTSS
jgi:DNA-directed RNA polymerase specialized sigma24 family protein